MHRVEQRDGASIVYVSGKLDVPSSQALASIITLFGGAHAQRIVVSLEDCNYCYAVGLAVLVSAQQAMGRNFFVVVPIAPRFGSIFEITGLNKVLQLVPTVQCVLEHTEEAKLGESVTSDIAARRITLKAPKLQRSA